MNSRNYHKKKNENNCLSNYLMVPLSLHLKAYKIFPNFPY